MSRIVGGIKANTSEQPHAGYNSRLKLDVTIPVADGSPMSIPIKDLALIIFMLITTNDWNGDGILITEVASALLKGLPNQILPDVKVSATVTKEGAPEDHYIREGIADWIVPDECPTLIKGLTDLMLDCVLDLEDLDLDLNLFPNLPLTA